ncbi:MAG: hypothetical protein JJT89_12835 [Nitriliruptoraceae bacterium]|nr:hypothetical protein [Nitriliruptoraceae bacterium]
MDGPDLWDALRAEGVDADDVQIRTVVRVAFAGIQAVRAESGEAAARRAAQAVQAALAYQLRRPDTEDMSSFEDDMRPEAD